MTEFTIDAITYPSRLAYFLEIEPMRDNEKYKSYYTRMCYKCIPEYVQQSKKSTLDFMYRKYHSDEEYSHTYYFGEKYQVQQLQLVY